MIPERLARTVLYESPWMNLYRDRIRAATGRIFEEMHVVDVAAAGVATILEDADRRVALVRVPRYAVGTCEWELPEGRSAVGESVEDTAAREALEETGWTSDSPEVLHSFHPLPGLSTHREHVVRRRAVALVAPFDRDEVEEVRWFTLDEIRTMLRERRVRDGFTMLALFLHLQDRGH